MRDRPEVTLRDLVKAFRSMHLTGTARAALANPAMRIAITTCAELRKRPRSPDPHSPFPSRRSRLRTFSTPPAVDVKRLAAGDKD